MPLEHTPSRNNPCYFLKHVILSTPLVFKLGCTRSHVVSIKRPQRMLASHANRIHVLRTALGDRISEKVQANLRISDLHRSTRPQTEVQGPVAWCHLLRNHVRTAEHWVHPRPVEPQSASQRDPQIIPLM